MAKAGAPIGNNNATKAQAWRGALHRALAQFAEDGVPRGQALNRIAERVVRQALAGDSAAISEIANRLDGKAVQGVSIAQDAQLRIVHRVE